MEEDGADGVEAAVEGAQVIVTSMVAYAEARAALARRHWEKGFTASEYGDSSRSSTPPGRATSGSA